MRLRDITESFDSNIEYTVLVSNNRQFTTEAVIGDRKIRFSATGDDPDNWEIEFYEIAVDDKRGYGKTGSGNPMQVFSFVLDSLKKFLSIYKPRIASFTSEKSDFNRSRLYSRLGKNTDIPGYHLEKIESEGSADIFAIVSDNLDETLVNISSRI